MNALFDLSSACEQWHRLAQREQAAILSEDWSGLAECQNSIRALQEKMSRLPYELTDGPLREQIAALVALECENSALLDQRSSVLKQALAEAHTAQRTLHALRGSYAAPEASNWSVLS